YRSFTPIDMSSMFTASGNDGHAQFSQNRLDRIGNRMGGTACKQQCYRLICVGHDKGAGVAPLAERLAIERLHNDLPLKNCGARWAVSNPYSSVGVRYTAPRQLSRTSAFAHEHVQFGWNRGQFEFTQSFVLWCYELWLCLRYRTVNRIRLGEVNWYESCKSCDRIGRNMATIEGAGLDNWITGSALIYIGQNMIVAENEKQSALFYQTADRPRRNSEMSDRDPARRRPITPLERECLNLSDFYDISWNAVNLLRHARRFVHFTQRYLCCYVHGNTRIRSKPPVDDLLAYANSLDILEAVRVGAARCRERLVGDIQDQALLKLSMRSSNAFGNCF